MNLDSLIGLVGVLVFTILVPVALMQLWANRQARKQQGQPAPAMHAELSHSHGTKPAVFYFTSRHCPACKSVGPVIDELASEFDDVLKVDVLASPEVARAFRIQGTPSTVVVAGGNIQRIFLGRVSLGTLRELLKEDYY